MWTQVSTWVFPGDKEGWTEINLSNVEYEVCHNNLLNKAIDFGAKFVDKNTLYEAFDTAMVVHACIHIF